MKRVAGILLIMALLLSGCGGSKKQSSAVAGDYVEETQQENSDAPLIVGNGDGEGEPDTTPQENGEGEPNTAPKPNTDNEAKPNTPVDTQKPSDEKTNPPQGGNDDQPAKDDKDNKTDKTDPPEYKDGNLLKIISYNIRYTDDEDRNSIDDRAPRLKTVLDRYDADLVGMQEVVPRWVAHIQNDYSAEYTVTYQYRSVSNSEGTLILWRTGKFELLDEGHFWLSETPDQESKAWGADLWRICNWVKLKVKATGKTFLFYNTHYDGGENWQFNAGEVMMKQMKKMGGFSKYPVFLTGDFNMTAGTNGYYYLVSDGDLEDVNEALEKDTTPTTNGYNNGDFGRIIDFVFYSPGKSVALKYQVLNEQVDGGYVSDHRGLYAEVAIL